MSTIVTAGKLLVDVTATLTGPGFKGPIELVGHHLHGAPTISIDQVATLGQPCAMISRVGREDSGQLNLNKPQRDGAHTAARPPADGYPTRNAFVRYRKDGDKDFVYNIVRSTTGKPPLTERSLGSAGPVLLPQKHLRVVPTSARNDSNPNSARPRCRAPSAAELQGGGRAPQTQR